MTWPAGILSCDVNCDDIAEHKANHLW